MRRCVNRGVLLGSAFLFGILIVLSANGTTGYPTITGSVLDAYDMSTLSVGKVKDFGSNGYDLTLVGSPVATGSGCLSGAYIFDRVNDHMTNANSPLVITGVFTIAMQIKVNAVADTNEYVLTFGSN